MTQRDLARESGVPQSSIARIERGTIVPRVDTFQRLLYAAGHHLSLERGLGDEVDRSQIRALPVLTPAQRGRAAATAGRSLLALRTRARDKSTST